MNAILRLPRPQRLALAGLLGMVWAGLLGALAAGVVALAIVHCGLTGAELQAIENDQKALAGTLNDCRARGKAAGADGGEDAGWQTYQECKKDAGLVP